MAKHLIDLDEDMLGAAQAELGTTTIKDTVNEALRRAAERDGDAALLVIDDSGDRDVPLTIQRIPTAGELLYFTQPSASRRAEILARHPVRRVVPAPRVSGAGAASRPQASRR